VDSPEGNIRERLEHQVKALKLEDNVRFWVHILQNIEIPLSAADLFVLATANEGWAKKNVLFRGYGVCLQLSLPKLRQ